MQDISSNGHYSSNRLLSGHRNLLNDGMNQYWYSPIMMIRNIVFMSMNHKTHL